MDSARIFFATNYSGPDDGSGFCQIRGDRVLTPDTIAYGVDLDGNRWGAVQIGDFVVVRTTDDPDDPENVQARCEFRFLLVDFPGKSPPNGIDIGGYTYWQLSSSDSQIGRGFEYVADYAIIDFVKGN